MTLDAYMRANSLTDAQVAAIIGRDRSMVTKLRNRQIACSIEVAASLQQLSKGTIMAEDLLPTKRSAPDSHAGFAESPPAATPMPPSPVRPGRKKGGDMMARITSNPLILGGKPCIRGMRMRVSDVVELMAHGASRAEILEDYPYLEDDDITAALLYAAEATGHRLIQAA